MTKLQALGLKLAVPFNHDERLLVGMERYRSDVAELYLPAPLDLVGTMRVWSGPPAAEYRRQLPSLARRMSDIGIAINMVMNTVYLPLDRHARVARYAASLRSVGIRRFTIADLHLATAVRNACPEAEIVVSVVADIQSVTRARHWRREVQACRLILPPILNKQPSRLAEIAGLGIPLELIADESCLPACPHAVQHACALSGWKTANEEAATRYTELCWDEKARRPWEHYQTEILPAQLARLKGRVSYLKLVGRGRPTDFILRELERYTAAASDRHEIFGYIEPDGVFDRVAACDRDCETCGYCEKAFRRANPGFDFRDSGWVGRKATENDRPGERASGRRRARS